MVVHADKEKMRALLKDTITLLCKNGLAYNAEFCVEALIGITLDKNDVMLVSINETVKSAAALQDEQDAKDAERQRQLEEELAETQAAEVEERLQAKEEGRPLSSCRKRQHSSASHMVKSERDSGGEDGGEEEYSPNGVSGDNFQDESSSHSEIPRPAKRRAPSKTEEDDIDDIIVIKEELDADSWNSQYEDPSNHGLPNQRTQQQYLGEDADLSQVLSSGGFPPSQQGQGTSWHQPSASTVTSESVQGDSLNPQQELSWYRSAGVEAPQTTLPHAYKCAICLRHFYTRGGFRDHMRTHTGQFRYTCPYCQRGFNQRTHFEGHVNVHEGKRPFVCGKCGKGFSLKSNANSHERSCSLPSSSREGQDSAVIAEGGALDAGNLRLSRNAFKAEIKGSSLSGDVPSPEIGES